MIPDNYNQMTFSLREQKEPRRRVDLIFRAYNEGIALRYYLHEQEALDTFTLASENTGFYFAGSASAYVLGTRCHHLALYVVYENPMPMVCDTPSSYEGQIGFEFIKQVPTTWDKTQFLEGEAGEYLVMGRCKDKIWYLGGITNDTGREIDVPLKILDPGNIQSICSLTNL